jgi:DNA-directed RNA polymerase specialized sigma24 family protein
MDEQLSDEQVAQTLDTDPPHAMLELAERYQQRLKRFIRALCGTEKGADELFPVVLNQYLQRWQAGTAKRRVAMELFSLAQRSAMAYALRFPAEIPAYEPMAGAAGLDLNLRWELLASALQSLDPQDRAALALTLFERFSYAEAAQILGQDPAALREQAGQALQTLHQRLGAGFFGAA